MTCGLSNRLISTMGWSTSHTAEAIGEPGVEVCTYESTLVEAVQRL